MYLLESVRDSDIFLTNARLFKLAQQHGMVDVKA